MAKPEAANSKAVKKQAEKTNKTPNQNPNVVQISDGNGAPEENSSQDDALPDEFSEDDLYEDGFFQDDAYGTYEEDIDRLNSPNVNHDDSGRLLADLQETAGSSYWLEHGPRAATRGLTADKDGLVNPSITAADIYNGGLRFLTANHVATTTLHNGVVISIPELFNYQQMEVALNMLKIKPANQNQQAPRDLPESNNTLDYVFNSDVQPGPMLTSKIAHVEGDAFEGERLSDIEIAKLMKKKGSERWKTAPYAYQTNGQVQPEYRHVLKKYMDEIGASEADKKSASPRGYDMEEWSPEKIKMAIQQRAEKATAAHWDIHLRVQGGYQPPLVCRECGEQIKPGGKEEHLTNVVHQAKNPLFDLAFDPNNTLQIVPRLSGMQPKAYTFSLPTDEYPDEKMVREIAHELVNFLQRWPARFHENMKVTALALVCKRVRDRYVKMIQGVHDPATKLPSTRYPRPYFQLRPGGPKGALDEETVGIEIYLFEPETLLPYKMDPYFQPKMMLRYMNVPDVPEYIIWTNRQRWKVGLRVIPEPITDPGVEKAVRLAKYLSFKLYGKVILEKAARRIVAYYRSFYENASLRFENFDQRHTLFNVTQNEHLGTSRIRASSSLRGMIQGNLPQVLVHTLDGGAVARVLNQGLSTFLLDGNPLSTWKALCRAGDAINDELREGGTISDPPCGCTKSTRVFTLHHCRSCFKVETCGDMSTSTAFEDARLRCRRCVIASSRPPSSPKKRAEHCLRRLIRSELGLGANPLPEAAAASLSLFHETWKNIEKPFLDDDIWKSWDRYTDAEPLVLQSEASEHTQIMGFSLDAGFPYFEYRNANGEWVRRIHCASNLWPTTVGHNLAKGVHLVGVLHLACVCWSYSHAGANSVLPVAELHDRLMEQADDMHLVRLQTPWKVLGRRKLPLDEREFAKTRKEWILSAPLTETRRKQYKSSRRYTAHIVPPREWMGKPRDWEERTYPIILEMEEKFCQKLSRGKDGCPFPGHISSMPKDWSFWTCRTTFTDKVSGMWAWCNGLWPQVDTAETLFLSACLYYLDPSRKEWLNLPISYYLMHPFRVSFGHRVHDRMLRSGWTTHIPSSLSQHDDSLNNLEVETAFSNYFKNNAVDADCARAKDHLLSITLPKDLYRPQKLLRPNHRSGSQYEPWSIDIGTAFGATRKLSVSSEAEDQVSCAGLEVPRKSVSDSSWGQELSEIDMSKGSVVPASATLAGTTSAPNVRTETRRRGIKNPGHFCWMNSTVQFLYMISPLRQAVFMFEHDQARGNLEVDLARHEMIYHLRKIFKALEAQIDRPIEPKILMNCVSTLHKALEQGKAKPRRLWSGSRAEDVHEFVIWFLEQLAEEEVLKPVLSILQQGLEEEVMDFCTLCPPQAVPRNTLPLPGHHLMTLLLPVPSLTALPSRGEFLAVSIARNFEVSTAQLDAACPRRIKGHGVRESRPFFTQLPEYLILHISRTTADGKRIGTHLIGTEVLDLAGFCSSTCDARLESYYELQSEIRHHIDEGASTDFGHYFTYSRNSPSQWTKFNDEEVSQASPFKDLHGRASLFLYKRVSRPSNFLDQGAIGEDDGAATSLKDLSTEIECQKAVVGMFYQHQTVGSMTLKDLLLAAQDGNQHIDDVNLWQRALYHVAIPVKRNRSTSIWLLRDSHTLEQGTMMARKEKIAAVLSKAQNPEVGTICYLVRYTMDDTLGEQALVSWERGKIFLANHITGPVRRMINEFESKGEGANSVNEKAVLENKSEEIA